MKLAYSLLDKPILIEENRISVLIIENALELRRAIGALKRQVSGADGEFVLSENGEIADIAKKADLVTDLFAIELDSKKMASKVTQYAVRAASDYSEEYQKIITQLNMLAAKVSTQMEFEASFSELENAEGIIKLFGFYVDDSTMSFPEKIVEYMRIHRLFFGTKLFSFYNLKALMDEPELIPFYKSVLYEKLNVLLIEDRQRTTLPQYENTVIVDNDLCVF